VGNSRPEGARHTPQWTRSNKLTGISLAALHAIDLPFHDLRHEAGSRLLEAGWPLHHVQEMLGNANVSQTSTYLNATKIGLQESMRRFDDSRCNPVANEGTIEHRPGRSDGAASPPNPLVK
jgi:integrase